MAVVVDANLVVVLATNDPRADSVDQQLRDWYQAGERLHATNLLPYEVANALTRLVVAGRLDPKDVAAVTRLAAVLPI